MPTAHCRSCQAPIIWAEHHETGRRTPFDAEPIEAGSWVLASAADTCRRLYLRLDRRDPPWPPEQEDAEADRPEHLPVPPNADKRYEEMDGG